MKFEQQEQEIEKMNLEQKWCYFLKNVSLTKEEEVSKVVGKHKILHKAYEELNHFNWTEEERRSYDHELKRVLDNEAVERYKITTAREEGRKEGKEEGKEEGRKEGKEEGRKEGKEEGRKEEKIQVIRNLLALGMGIEKVSKVVGLSEEEIKGLEK